MKEIRPVKLVFVNINVGRPVCIVIVVVVVVIIIIIADPIVVGHVCFDGRDGIDSAGAREALLGRRAFKVDCIAVHAGGAATDAHASRPTPTCSSCSTRNTAPTNNAHVETGAGAGAESDSKTRGVA